MKTVHLLGELGERFGTPWKVRCSRASDIFRLIDCQSPSFRSYLYEAAEAGVQFEVLAGDEILDEPELLDLKRDVDEYYISAIPSGSKGGAGRLLAAAAIIAITFATGGFGAGASGFATLTTTGGQIATAIAVNLAITGLTELLAPGPETDGDANEGYFFNGPENTVQQGLPVPVCYGELVVGGAPINVSFQSQPFQLSGYNYSKVADTPYGSVVGPTYLNNVIGRLPESGNIYSFSVQDTVEEA